MSTLIHHMRVVSRLALASFLAFVLVPALGGGGVTGTGQSVNLAIGLVEDFGSVFVNGIEYFTTGADIVIEGVHGQPESRLRVGMPVHVAGALNADGRTGTAQSVRYDADLRGNLDGPAAVATDGVRFSVNGLIAVADERTVFEGALDAFSLATGERIEVSGFRDSATGLLHAMFVTRTPLAANSVVSGPISGVSPGSFVLGSLTVTYDSSMAPPLAVGMIVRAVSDSAPSGGVLAASLIEVLDGKLAAPAGTDASAEGVVSRLSATGFIMGGLLVQVNSATKFRNGTAADLANGDLVEAQGTAQADGSLLASRITFPSPDRAAAQAVVAAKSAAGFVLAIGRGIAIQVNSETKFRDNLSVRVGGFSWKELRVGDRVDVAGLEVDRATILAESVTRVDPSAGVAFSARARAVQSPSIVLLATQALAGTGATYQDAGGSALSAEAFFAKVAGRRVKAVGMNSADGVLVGAFEIEP